MQWLPHDGDDLRQLSLRQSVAELGRIAISRIGENHVGADACGQRVVDEGDRDLPLLRELDLDRKTDGASTRSIVCPCFRQEQAHADARAAQLAGEMNADRDLAIIDAAERARILTRDADRVFPFLGKSGVVDDERLDAGQLAIDLRRYSRKYFRVGPRRKTPACCSR